MAQNFPTEFPYDVFLSFRGEDTRYNFTGNLNDAFRRRGIKTFFDDRELRAGDELSSALFTAIEKSRMFVIVLSENYASSTWCLNELVQILQCAEQNSRLIWPIFYKVHPSDIRHLKGSYGKAMIEHEKRFGKNSERVLNWRSALAKVAELKGEHLTGKEYECKFFEKIVQEISRLLPKYFYVEEQVVVGLEPRKKEVESLLDISSCNMVCMLGIHGIGGIGKTMLTKALYNSIADQFDHVKFLCDVRETSNRPEGLLSLQKKLLSNMFEEENISSIDEGVDQIRKTLNNKRVLLVLDDVNCVEQLEVLAGECNWFGFGSRIIVTTRDRNLLQVHEFENKKSYEMTGLNSDEALELFCLKAFKRCQPLKEFEDLSNDVINYAGGLPLALKMIGSNLYGNDLQTCVSALDQYRNMLHEKIQNILRVSYDSLNVYQKDIFLDIACFF